MEARIIARMSVSVNGKITRYARYKETARTTSRNAL
jgi:hypothetical protein